MSIIFSFPDCCPKLAAEKILFLASKRFFYQMSWLGFLLSLEKPCQKQILWKFTNLSIFLWIQNFRNWARAETVGHNLRAKNQASELGIRKNTTETLPMSKKMIKSNCGLSKVEEVLKFGCIYLDDSLMRCWYAVFKSWQSLSILTRHEG